MARLALLFSMLALTFGLRLRAADEYTDPPITPEEKSHWAFKPPVRSTISNVKNRAWIRNPIDAFVLAKLEAAGLKPAPEADRLTLCRRLYLDLLGLPPTAEEITAFLNDKSPEAFEKLVDQLLASPHYGERWATHWLDVVRFAESNGYELDAERPQAWRYRDYVIKSFNDDKPYDRFLTEQIAGDELAATKEGNDATELWIATGLHRCGPVHVVSGNLEQDVIRQEVLTEMVNGLGSSVLGLTIGCARCHDHKFDPLSQGDYYRLQAFFTNAKYTDVDFATPEEKAAREINVNEITAKTAPLKKQVADIDAPIRTRIAQQKLDRLEQKYKDALTVPPDKRTAEEKRLVGHTIVLLKVTWEDVLDAMPAAEKEKRLAIREQIHAIEANLPPPTAAAWAIKHGDDKTQTFVLKRGSAKSKWTAVEMAFPRIVATETTTAKTRLELAKWIARADHPLTGRVIVNRLWQHHFGRGIVATANDFGVRGDSPTHPELLDWLAIELTSKNWSLKHIHRLIVLSSTYRQSTVVSAETRKSDPDNKLLARMNRRRLEAEAIRDSILTTAGTLNRERGGPSVKVPLEPEVYDLIFTEAEPDGLWPVTPDVRQHTRRSIYLFNKRNVRLPMFEAFDQPDTLNSCADRPVSTFAPQALILMNGPFVQGEGKALAVKLVRDVGNDPAKQVDALYRRALGRAATSAENELAIAFLKAQTATIHDRLRARQPIGLNAKDFGPDTDLAAARALADLCVVVFNTNEFVYIP